MTGGSTPDLVSLAPWTTSGTRCGTPTTTTTRRSTPSPATSTRRSGPRTVQWATIDGRQYHVLGGKVSRAVTNATFDPISKPGCLSEYFRGNPNHVNPLELIRDHEPIRPEYRDPAARLRVLDEQGLAGCFLFPTLGMIYEEPLKRRPRGGVHHVPCVQPVARRGLDLRLRGPHPHRARTSPSPTCDWAVEELEWALDAGRTDDRDASRPRPPPTPAAAAPSTRGSTRSGRGWTRPGITVVVHAGDSGQSSNGYAVDGFAANFRCGGFGPTHQELPHRGGDPRLPPVDDALRPLQEVPEPPDRVGGERRRVPPRPVPEAPIPGQEDAGLVRRGPGRPVPPARLDQPVLGGRPRHRRRPSWAPTG